MLASGPWQCDAPFLRCVIDQDDDVLVLGADALAGLDSRRRRHHGLDARLPGDVIHERLLGFVIQIRADVVYQPLFVQVHGDGALIVEPAIGRAVPGNERRDITQRLEPFGPKAIDPELTTEGSSRRQAECSLSPTAEAI